MRKIKVGILIERAKLEEVAKLQNEIQGKTALSDFEPSSLNILVQLYIMWTEFTKGTILDKIENKMRSIRRALA